MNVSKEVGGRLAATPAGTTIQVDPNYDYTIVHTGKLSNLTVALDDVALGFDGAPADGTLGLNKLVMSANDAMGLPVGVNKISIKSLGSGSPVIQIIRGNVNEYYK